MLRRALLVLALSSLAGCAENERREVAWVRYDQAHAEWRADHARWERQKAERDRRAQRSLERQWPQPTSAAPDDPLAPEPAPAPAPAPFVERRSSGSSSADSDWTPPPPTHYVPEDERPVVRRSSSVDVDVSLGLGYGVYVGPRVYHRPRLVGAYYTGYGYTGYGYDSCAPRTSIVYSSRCGPSVYVAPRRVYYQRPSCGPTVPAYCPPARVSFTHRSHGHVHSGRGFSPAPAAPVAPGRPSWAVKN